jgi:hypothetical protein
MRDFDLEIYSTLIKRPGLIIGSNDLNKVEDFIRAYDLGSKGECNFMILLTNHLHRKYEIGMPSDGLIQQFKLIASKIEKDWKDIFIEETKEVLRNESDGSGLFRFQKILRSKILKYFEDVPDEVNMTYFINLNQINRQIDDWVGVNLRESEIELFIEVKDLVLVETCKPYEKVIITSGLKNKIMLLKELIKKEASFQI